MKIGVLERYAAYFEQAQPFAIRHQANVIATICKYSNRFVQSLDALSVKLNV